MSYNRPIDDLAPFASAEHLINCAEESLVNFEVECANFLKGNNPDVIHEVDKDTSENVYILQFPSTVPLPLRKTATDIVCSLRNALDQAMCDAATEAGTLSTGNVYFPVGQSVRDFEGQIKRKCKGVHPDLVDFCRSLEPYKNGRGEVLWLLSRVAGASKHRRIIHLVQQVHTVAYPTGPTDSTKFTGPMHFHPVWTKQAGRVEFGRGPGAIHGRLRVSTKIVVDTESASASVQDPVSLKELLSICRTSILGLQHAVKTIAATLR